MIVKELKQLQRLPINIFSTLFGKLKYKYYSNKKYNLNIIGIRTNKDPNKKNNRFDDYLVVEYFDEKQDFIRLVFPITTVPGIKSLNKPQNTNGCAILKEGQYIGLWKVGLHKGEYKALVQNNPCTVYRDNDKNDYINIDKACKQETGVFGINLHKAGVNSELVDGWSAGCQVFKQEGHFNSFMSVVEQSQKNFPDCTYTYTLINESVI